MKQFLKKKSYTGCVLLGIILLLFLSNYVNIKPFDKSESYIAFYRTISQVLGSIITLVGAFTIFMINSTDDKIFHFGNKLLRSLRNRPGENRVIVYSDLDTYLNEGVIRNHFQNNNKFIGDRAIFISLKIYRQQLAFEAYFVLVLLTTILIGSLLLITQNEVVIQYHRTSGLYFLIAIMSLAFWGLIETVILIIGSVSHATNI